MNKHKISPIMAIKSQLLNTLTINTMNAIGIAVANIIARIVSITSIVVNILKTPS